MLAALLLALAAIPGLAAGERLPRELVNPSFEQDLRGWQVSGHRGLGAGVMTNAGLRWPQAAQGEAWLETGWRARSAAPRGAQKTIVTLVDARRYRGRRLRFSALTRAPSFASGASALRARTYGPGGTTEASAYIGASGGWRLHSVDFAVPRDARAVEIGFVVQGTRSQLDADAVRLEILP